MKPSIHMTSGVAALAMAAMVTGCCGPDADRRASTSRPYATTTYQQPTTTTETTAVQETDRTRVRESTTAQQNEGDWSLPLYSERLQVGKREVDNGAVRLKKVVRTETVSEPVQLSRETVVIDRQAFDQAQRAAEAGQQSDFGARFEEKEIVIELQREEPVVELQTVMTGRIIANKQRQTDQQTVQRQVRTEDIQIVKTGNANDQDIRISDRVNVRVENVGAPGTGTGREERQDVRELEENQQRKADEIRDNGVQNQPGTNNGTLNNGATPTPGQQ